VTPIHLALVVEAPEVSSRAALEITAALQRQLTRDVAPIWEVHATIDAFAALEHVPPGYWPIIVGDHWAGVEAVGMHIDLDGQPFAIVEASPSWSLIASHEAIEMVTDPWGNRVVPGGSPMQGQGLVDVLVEVCDPVGGPSCAYTVNGYLVSDFVTPSYYDPIAASGVRYSFTGSVDGPRQVQEGGYLSWRDPATGEWWQCDRVQRSELSFRRLGPLDDDGRPIREQIDVYTLMIQLFTGTSRDDPALLDAYERRASTRAASEARAAAIRAKIQKLGLG
jgi:hypothetical protein